MGNINNNDGQVAVGSDIVQTKTDGQIGDLAGLVVALGTADITGLAPLDLELFEINVATLDSASADGAIEQGQVRAALLSLRAHFGNLVVGAAGSTIATLIEPLLGLAAG